MHTVIYTEQLVLTQVEKLDVGFLSYCLSSSEARGPFLSATPIEPWRVEKKRLSGAYWNDDSKTFIIKLKKAQTRIGIFHYWIKPNDRSTAMYAVQIAVAEQRNLGYGTEVQLAAIKSLFRIPSIENIEVYTDMNNLAEVRCLEKLGFRYCESKTYLDMNIERTGNLYRLTRTDRQKMESFL